MDPEDERELEKLKREKRKAEKKDNHKEVAQIHNCIGELLYKYERFEEAIKEHEAERLLSEALQDTIGEAVACRKIGECYCALAQYDKALTLQQRHLSLAKACDDAIEEQRALATIGRTYLFQSETCRGHNAVEASKKAEKAFIKALEVCERLRESMKNEELMEMKARLFLNLGLVYDGQGNYKQSADFMKRAITLAEKYKLVSDVYRCQISLAGMYQRTENWSQALRSLEEAQKCASKLKDKLLENEVFTNRAQILMRIGDFPLAKHCLKKVYKQGSPSVAEETRVLKLFKAASKMEESTEELDKEGITLQQQFKLYEVLGDSAADATNFKQAIEFYINMLECGEQLGIGNKERIPIFVSLAQTYADDRQFSQAVQYYKKELACRDDDPEQACRTWLNIAEAEELGGVTYEKISQTYLSAFDAARKAKNRKLQIHVLKSLIEVQKMFKQKGHQHQTEEKLIKLKTKYDIGSGDELSDSELDTQQSEQDDEDNLSIAELTESECSDEETALPTASRRRNTSKPKVNEKGETQLHRACIEGNLKKVQNLLEKGHPVNSRDYCGWIPLHEAANHDHYEIVKVLLENGAAVNDRGGKHCGGITPLIDAGNCGNTEIMKLLIGHGANVHNKDDDGQTALDSLRGWHQRCEDTLSRELEADYTHMEKTLLTMMKGGRAPSDIMASQTRTKRPADVLDLYDDERSTQSLPDVKVRTKRKRNSTGSKPPRNILASDSEGEMAADSVGDVNTEDSEFYPNPLLDDLVLSGSATDNYRTAIHGLGSATQRGPGRTLHSDKTDRRKSQADNVALLDVNDFVDDDWLIDDVQPQKRKKLDVGNVFSTNGSRKSGSDTKRTKSDSVKKKSIVLDESDDEVIGNSVDAPPVFDNDSYDNGDDFVDNDVLITTFQNRSENIQPPTSNRSKLSTKNKPRQTKLTLFGVSDSSTKSSQPLRSNSPIPGPSQNGFPQSFPSQNVQTAETSMLTSVMRLKVTIEGQMLLVPVMDVNQTISWLSEEVSKRYEKIHQKKPIVTMRTRDGAILSPDDVVSMVLTNNEVVDAMVDSWDMQPLHERYKQACKLSKTVEYRNIVSLLQSSDVTASLDLHNLALRPAQILPVCRALEGQNSLKHLNLQSNRLGDNGMSALSKAVCSLPGLAVLNLSGNEITTVGLQLLADMLQSAHTSNCKPLQALTTLNLSHNPIGDNCTSSISTLLSCLPSLTDLTLSACQLTANFFSKHRLMLANAVQGSNLQSLNISHNRLGSLGLEQLLKSLNPQKMTSLDLSETHAGSTISHLSLNLQQFLTQDGCKMEDIRLVACHLSVDDGYFITRLPSLCKSLKRLDLSANSHIDNSVVQEMMLEAVRNDCSLEELAVQGCAMKSPLDSNFLDALTDKLSSELHPLRSLDFSCVNLDKVDADCLRQIWTDRWKDLTRVDFSGNFVKLGVTSSS